MKVHVGCHNILAPPKVTVTTQQYVAMLGTGMSAEDVVSILPPNEDRWDNTCLDKALKKLKGPCIAVDVNFAKRELNCTLYLPIHV